MRILFVVAAMIGLFVSNAVADAPPPQGAKPLSELLQSIEQRGGFRYIDEVDWDHGTYEVEYYTQAGAKVKIQIDPVSGKQLPH